jgi:pectin lyase
MSITSILSLLLLAGHSLAVGVVGKAEGFAASTTGGGSATPQYPANIAELKTWLTDSTARVIVLNKEHVPLFQSSSRNTNIHVLGTTSLAVKVV